MKITGATKVVGIFGDPVEHSISPVMQNAAFSALNLDFVYIPLRVSIEPAGDLEKAVAGIRAMNLRGVNITIPHKERVMEYLDEVSELAREIGAVNTVVNTDGLLTGHNTDGPGYILSLRKRAGFTPTGKRILIYGAGGAARAIVFSILATAPSAVMIANRTVERAEALVQIFKGRFPEVEIGAGLPESGPVKAFAGQADLVINTTPLGMEGGDGPDIPLSSLPGTAIVSDIVYTPLETGLLRRAKERGLKTLGGLSMLVKQGAVTFELWTGKKAPLDVMREAALGALTK